MIKIRNSRIRYLVKEIILPLLAILAAIIIPLKVGDCVAGLLLVPDGPYRLLVPALWFTGAFTICILGIAICLVILIGMAIAAVVRKVGEALKWWKKKSS